jgi:hypothetical protein
LACFLKLKSEEVIGVKAGDFLRIRLTKKTVSANSLSIFLNDYKLIELTLEEYCSVYPRFCFASKTSTPPQLNYGYFSIPVRYKLREPIETNSLAQYKDLKSLLNMKLEARDRNMPEIMRPATISILKVWQFFLNFMKKLR